jgi:hypothetical protein
MYSAQPTCNSRSRKSAASFVTSSRCSRYASRRILPRHACYLVHSSVQLEAAPRDLGRQWEDPLAQGGERVFASELKNLHTQASQPSLQLLSDALSLMLM